MDASCTLLFLLVEGKERIGAWGWEGGYSVRNVMSDNFLIPQISISVLLGNVTWLYDHNGNRKFFWKLTKIFRKGHLFWTDENVSERDPNLHCWTKLQFNWKLEKQTNTTPPPPTMRGHACSSWYHHAAIYKPNFLNQPWADTIPEWRHRRGVTGCPLTGGSTV